MLIFYRPYQRLTFYESGQINLAKSADIPYIYSMELIFIETPNFVDKFDKIASNSEMQDLNELFENPFKGDIIRGTGGARKIRMKIAGKGKRGGGRVIYYYVDLHGEIWFLDIYLKTDQTDISEKQKKRLYNFIKETIHGQFE